jgi:hypothetical protein
VKLTIERAANGYVVRGDDRDDLAVVVGDKDPADAAQLLMWEVNERIGHQGTRYDAKRARAVVMPGDKWVPALGEVCDHPWIEGWTLGGRRRWWCPCGVEFTATPQGEDGPDRVEAAPSGVS